MSHNNLDYEYLSSLFTSENIIIFNQRPNPDEIFSELLRNLALTYGIGNVNHIYQDYIRRNGHLSPQVINNIALIQHFRLSTTENIRIAFAVIKDGIEYQYEEKSIKIHFCILITSPKKRPDLYLRILKIIRYLITEENKILSEILENTDSDAIWKIIDQKNLKLPSYILASDIMLQPRVVIREENNLEDAIDLFTKSGVLFIPVVDKDGDLLGEVTLQELMHVCLPRYILWMDDFKPTLNFEPFRNMIHNESNTWLDEIMTHDIAKVNPNDPAIKAGIEMTKFSTDHVYVLDDKKLSGIISLQYFSAKVLRE